MKKTVIALSLLVASVSVFAQAAAPQAASGVHHHHHHHKNTAASK
jgi:Spy/CpxP family protein refolding chaperone